MKVLYAKLIVVLFIALLLPSLSAGQENEIDPYLEEKPGVHHEIFYTTEVPDSLCRHRLVCRIEKFEPDTLVKPSDFSSTMINYFDWEDGDFSVEAWYYRIEENEYICHAVGFNQKIISPAKWDFSFWNPKSWFNFLRHTKRGMVKDREWFIQFKALPDSFIYEDDHALREYFPSKVIIFKNSPFYIPSHKEEQTCFVLSPKEARFTPKEQVMLMLAIHPEGGQKAFDEVAGRLARGIVGWDFDFRIYELEE